MMHREDTHVAEVEMRPLGGNGSVDFAPATSAKLAAAERMSAVVEDALDVLVSNAIENQTDSEGYHTLDIDALLTFRRRLRGRYRWRVDFMQHGGNVSFDTWWHCEHLRDVLRGSTGSNLPPSQSSSFAVR